MAVTLKFGLPGCGKTTFMVHDILKAQKSGRYLNYYCNVHTTIPGVTYIDNDCIGKYELRDCALFIDEATLFADSRDYKNFGKGRLEYFLEHRHRCADIFLYTQQWDGVDRKIRTITDRVYYIYKGFWTGRWISSSYRIPYGIIIPDPKKGESSKLGEIIQGYCKPPLLIRLFAIRLYRPKYYQYFDSWELKELPPLPVKYQPYCPDTFPESKKLFCCVHSIKRWIQDKWLRIKFLASSLLQAIKAKGKFTKKGKVHKGDPEIYR